MFKSIYKTSLNSLLNEPLAGLCIRVTDTITETEAVEISQSQAYAVLAEVSNRFLEASAYNLITELKQQVDKYDLDRQAAIEELVDFTEGNLKARDDAFRLAIKAIYDVVNGAEKFFRIRREKRVVNYYNVAQQLSSEEMAKHLATAELTELANAFVVADDEYEKAFKILGDTRATYKVPSKLRKELLAATKRLITFIETSAEETNDEKLISLYNSIINRIDELKIAPRKKADNTDSQENDNATM